MAKVNVCDEGAGDTPGPLLGAVPTVAQRAAKRATLSLTGLEQFAEAAAREEAEDEERVTTAHPRRARAELG